MKMCLGFGILLIVLPYLSLQAESTPQTEKTNFVLDLKRNDYGLFSCFTMVLGTLEAYETGIYQGIWINFGKNGAYYDPALGPNWWEYYFKPIRLGQLDAPLPRSTRSQAHKMARLGRRLTPERAYELISRYIQLQGDIQEEIDQFAKKEFANCHVIGIHYRGTDKVTSGEAVKVNYDAVADEIKRHLAEKGLADFKIFIATDETPFIDYLSALFPGKIVYTQAQRSSDNLPVHMKAQKPYKVGREAIVDALLLSKTAYLIRTKSNLSLCSTFFNPNLPVKLL